MGTKDATSQDSQQQSQEQASPQQTIQMAERVKDSLEAELKKGQIEVETEDNKVIIRLLEQGFFPQGRAEFNYKFYPVLDKIRISLAEIPGTVKVIGHTDNQSMVGTKFRSNWELSAARAVSVVQTLLDHSELLPDQIKLDPKRFSVIGKADTSPRAVNDTEENRIKNRRVEIIIEQDPDAAEEIDDSVAPDDELLEEGWIEEQIFGGTENNPKHAVKPDVPAKEKAEEVKAAEQQKPPAQDNSEEEVNLFDEGTPEEE
jgi:outer membrane protein OmpA-like peptidoglycan-associated protein